MSNKSLKGLTIKIGGDTSELNKSLEKAEKQGRSLSSELGQINKLLKLDPSNTELLAQKQKVLAEAIANTESKLDTLKEAERQVQAQFERGEVSEAQYRALQREIIETENKLNKYKNAAKETADAVEALGRETGEVADKLDEQAAKTEEAEKATEGLDNAAGDLAKGGLAAAITAAAAATAAVVALAEESREYRTEMGKLDTAFIDNGFSAETATKTYEALQGVLGETEQAVEASNNLAALCDTEENLSDWTAILTGVYGKFGASLPVEGLAEAANETKRVGQVTGPLADALNWAAKEGESFGVTLKKNTKANEEWNKKVKEAASAEDYFNLALEECSNEQERQQLITKTLTQLYGSAATQYKKTNAGVIRANEATEKWNKITAKIGKTVDPVVTDIKEFGATILEDAGKPLEDIANYIQKDALPAITKAGNWVKNNGPIIKSTTAGVTAALVAYKAATVAATIEQKGLRGAIMATEVAQKALALAQAATPWGLMITAIAGLTAATIALTYAQGDAIKPADALTQEERDLMAAADDAAAAFRDQRKATDEALGNITAEMTNTQSLADELRGLASASGEVQEKDQARVQFILNELNQALGTEYELVGGVIQKYGELESSINDVIQAKTANALLEAANADYVAAIQNEADAYDNMSLKLKDYEAQRDHVQQKQKEYDQYYAEVMEMKETATADQMYMYDLQLGKMASGLEAEKSTLNEKKVAYEQSATDYYNHVATIENYTNAQTAALEGNYQTTLDLLTRKSGAYNAYSTKVDEETAKVLNTLQEEAVNAGIKADITRKNFEDGVAGFTEEMVKEAEEGYQAALDEFANAYADAESVGEDMAQGMVDGAENKRPSLLEKARSLVQDFLAAVRDESDTHSPSRKAIAIFEDIGDGAVVGTENKTPEIKKAGEKQAAAVLDAYSEQEASAQKALRSVAEQQAARQTAGQLTAATANSGVLEQILTAIQEGQVIALDGNILVGATADRMDRALGRRQILTSRGAI